jgi:cytochrome c oxidase subunit 2
MPDPIELPAGSEVTFYITSRDVVHGFEVAGTNINAMVIPGEVSKITAEFDEPGEHGIVCHEYCGSGHHDMAGKLIVREPSNFTMTDDTEPTTASTANRTTAENRTTTGRTASPAGGEGT